MYIYTQILVYCIIFIISFCEEWRGRGNLDSHWEKRVEGEREGNYGQSQTIRNWKRTKERKIILTEPSKRKIIKMELRFLMTGSQWPPARVRVVRQPTGSSTVSRRAWSYNWVNVLLGTNTGSIASDATVSRCVYLIFMMWQTETFRCLCRGSKSVGTTLSTFEPRHK